MSVKQLYLLGVDSPLSSFLKVLYHTDLNCKMFVINVTDEIPMFTFNSLEGMHTVVEAITLSKYCISDFIYNASHICNF